MSTKHTPGPWYVIEGQVWRRPKESLYEYGGDVAGDKPLATINKGWYEGTGFPVEANARLIAAAPELLDALEWLERILRAGAIPSKESAQSMADKARAAIAKAKGLDQ